MGRIYQIDDAIKSELRNLNELSDWYHFMGSLDLDQVKKCELEDSWVLWQEATRSLTSPLHFLFTGELKPNEYESGDPYVGFIGASNVSEISRIFETKDEAYFTSLLETSGFSSDSDIWLYKKLRNFFNDCSKNGKAVLFLLN